MKPFNFYFYSIMGVLNVLCIPLNVWTGHYWIMPINAFAVYVCWRAAVRLGGS